MVKSCDYDWETLLARSKMVRISFMKPPIEFDAPELILREQSSTICDLLDGDASVVNDGKVLKISLPLEVCKESLKPIVIILKIGHVELDSDAMKNFSEMYVIASYLGLNDILDQLKEEWSEEIYGTAMDVFKTQKFKEIMSDDHFRELIEYAKSYNPDRFKLSTLGAETGLQIVCMQCQKNKFCNRYVKNPRKFRGMSLNSGYAFAGSHVCSECALKLQIDDKQYLSMIQEWALRKENHWDMQILMTGICGSSI